MSIAPIAANAAAADAAETAPKQPPVSDGSVSTFPPDEELSEPLAESLPDSAGEPPLVYVIAAVSLSSNFAPEPSALTVTT